jgi:UDP-N-acetylmuramoyl-L-alanyl-D-glutamate--2,6-diaminopimelate ligase
MSLTLLSTAPVAASWLARRCSGQLRSDSRLVQPGDAFLAWPGATRDARQFVQQALASGAGAALVEAEGAAALGLDGTRVAAMPNLKARAGEVADAWFGQPTQRLSVLAVTGTNGKSSTAWWLSQALSTCGQRCGLVGTLGVGEPSALQSTGLTTPDPVSLQAAFADFVSQGFAACAIEASSIGLAEHRLSGTRLAVALFSNFTQDHLDYHGSMAAYWAAKRRLFDWPGLAAAVVHVDDAQGARLADELQAVAARDAAPGPVLWTVGRGQGARLRASEVVHGPTGLGFRLSEVGGETVCVATSLVGDFNVSNLLLVMGGMRALGIPLDRAAAAVTQLGPVPGRLQRVASGHGADARRLPAVVVDYAHTPDALDKALQALRPMADAGGGRLWCVFGCGGDRDASKRPQMGALAAARADRVVVTSDNPRSEHPQAIIEQIVAGIGASQRRQLHTQVDRRQAIAQAVREASPADVVLIAGKGHEDYQEVDGVKHPFSDVEEARRALDQRGERA